MSILALTADVRVADVEVTEDELTVRMMDGRTISVPLVWYPRLLNATQAQRKNWRIAGGGYGIHWEEIDEDLSTEGLLRGAPAHRQSRVKIDSSPLRRENRVVHAVSEDEKLAVEVSEDGDEKGLFDHLADGEEASHELAAVLSQIADETYTVGSKLKQHTNQLKGKGGAAKAGGAKKFSLMAAAVLNTFSNMVEGVLPRFEKSVRTLDESYSAIVKYADPESSEDVVSISTLRKSLSGLLDEIKPAKEGVTVFRDSALKLSTEQKIAKDVKRAAARLARVLDGVIHNVEQVETFALNVNFLIDEKFGNQQNSAEDTE